MKEYMRKSHWRDVLIDTDDEDEQELAQTFLTDANATSIKDPEEESIEELVDRLAEQKSEQSGDWRDKCAIQLPLMQAEQQMRAEEYMKDKENQKANIFQQELAADMFANVPGEVMDRFYPTEHTDLEKCHKRDWLSQQNKGQTDDYGMDQTYTACLAQAQEDYKHGRGRVQEDEPDDEPELVPVWDEQVWREAEQFQSETDGISILQDGEVVNIAYPADEIKLEDKWNFSIIKGENKPSILLTDLKSEAEIIKETDQKTKIEKPPNQVITNWSEPLDFSKPTYPYSPKINHESAYLDKMSDDYRNPDYYKRPLGKIETGKEIYYVAVDRIQRAAERNGWLPTNQWLGRLIAQMVTVEAGRDKEKAIKQPLSQKMKRIHDKTLKDWKNWIAEPELVQVRLVDEMRMEKPPPEMPKSLANKVRLAAEIDVSPPHGYWDRWRDNAYQSRFQEIVDEVKPKPGELVIAQKFKERIGVPDDKGQFWSFVILKMSKRYTIACWDTGAQITLVRNSVVTDNIDAFRPTPAPRDLQISGVGKGNILIPGTHRYQMKMDISGLETSTMCWMVPDDMLPVQVLLGMNMATQWASYSHDFENALIKLIGTPLDKTDRREIINGNGVPRHQGDRVEQLVDLAHLNCLNCLPRWFQGEPESQDKVESEPSPDQDRSRPARSERPTVKVVAGTDLTSLPILTSSNRIRLNSKPDQSVNADDLGETSLGSGKLPGTADDPEMGSINTYNADDPNSGSIDLTDTDQARCLSTVLEEETSDFGTPGRREKSNHSASDRMANPNPTSHHDPDREIDSNLADHVDSTANEANKILEFPIFATTRTVLPPNKTASIDAFSPCQQIDNKDWLLEGRPRTEIDDWEVLPSITTGAATPKVTVANWSSIVTLVIETGTPLGYQRQYRPPDNESMPILKKQKSANIDWIVAQKLAGPDIEIKRRENLTKRVAAVSQRRQINAYYQECPIERVNKEPINAEATTDGAFAYVTKIIESGPIDVPIDKPKADRIEAERQKWQEESKEYNKTGISAYQPTWDLESERMLQEEAVRKWKREQIIDRAEQYEEWELHALTCYWLQTLTPPKVEKIKMSVEAEAICMMAESNLAGIEMAPDTDPRSAGEPTDIEIKARVEKTTTKQKLPEKGKETLETFLKEYKRIFNTSLAHLKPCNLVEHSIDIGDAQPFKINAYRISPENREQMIDCIDIMLKAGVVVPSMSPFSSPCLLVPKKDGTMRFVTDYRRLNAATKKDAYPLPRIDDLLDKLTGAKYFSALDLLSGYWQVPLRAEDCQKTAFATIKGLFEYRRMPFGLCNAPATFQRTVQIVLGPLIGHGVEVYIDDVIIYSKTFDEHMTLMKQVFERLLKFNLFVKWVKCEFLADKVEYLGHVISAAGVATQEKKIAMINKLEAPTNIKQLRGFLGMTGYYRRFVPNYGTLSGPLNELLKKDVVWEWTTKRQDVWLELKKRLMAPPILISPDVSKKFLLQTDASLFGIGAVLSQKDEKGHDHAVAYASRSLKGAELRMATIEKECLAIFWAVKYFQIYLRGVFFEIITDHMPLKWLMKNEQPSARLMRWSLMLQEFDFRIIHKSGITHGNADFMSRLDLPDWIKSTEMTDDEKEKNDKFWRKIKPNENQECDACLDLLTEVDDEMNAHGNDFEMWYRPCEEVRKIQMQEQEWADKIEYLEKRAKNSKDPDLLDKKWTEMKINPKEWRVFRGCLQYRCRRKEDGRLSPWASIAPKSIRCDLLLNYHNNYLKGHMGVKRTQKLLLTKWWWPNITTDVYNWVKNCTICAQADATKQRTSREFKPIDAQYPNQVVAIDLMTGLPTTERGNKYCMTMIDCFTKYAVAVAIPDKTKTTIRHYLEKYWFTRFGPPEILLSDNGGEFDNEAMQYICDRYHVRHRMISPYRPPSNGVCERWNRTLAKMLKAYVADAQTSWDIWLHFCAYSYNTSINEMTGDTPFYLTHGRDPALPIELLLRPPSEMPKVMEIAGLAYNERMSAALWQAWNIAREQMTKVRMSYRKQGLKKRHTVTEVKVGDLVFVHDEQLGRPPNIKKKARSLLNKPEDTSDQWLMDRKEPSGPAQKQCKKLTRPYKGPYRVVKLGHDGFGVFIEKIDKTAKDRAYWSQVKRVHIDRIRIVKHTNFIPMTLGDAETGWEDIVDEGNDPEVGRMEMGSWRTSRACGGGQEDYSTWLFPTDITDFCSNCQKYLRNPYQRGPHICYPIFDTNDGPIRSDQDKKWSEMSLMDRPKHMKETAKEVRNLRPCIKCDGPTIDDKCVHRCGAKFDVFRDAQADRYCTRCRKYQDTPGMHWCPIGYTGDIPVRDRLILQKDEYGDLEDTQDSDISFESNEYQMNGSFDGETEKQLKAKLKGLQKSLEEEGDLSEYLPDTQIPDKIINLENNSPIIGDPNLEAELDEMDEMKEASILADSSVEEYGDTYWRLPEDITLDTTQYSRIETEINQEESQYFLDRKENEKENIEIPHKTGETPDGEEREIRSHTDESDEVLKTGCEVKRINKRKNKNKNSPVKVDDSKAGKLTKNKHQTRQKGEKQPANSSPNLQERSTKLKIMPESEWKEILDQNKRAGNKRLTRAATRELQKSASQPNLVTYLAEEIIENPNEKPGSETPKDRGELENNK